MKIPFFSKTRLLLLCLALSVLTHILIVFALRMFGTYDFTTPIALSSAVVVDMAQPADTDSSSTSPKEQESGDDPAEEDAVTEDTPDSVSGDTASAPPANHEKRLPAPEPKSAVNETKNSKSGINSPDKSHQTTTHSNSPPLSNVSNFLSTKCEKLTYLISTLGIPIGSAELEAKNDNGEVWLTLRVRSNTVISSVYPVDDLVETRHIDGKFILTKIKQLEGSYKSDEGFTINLQKKKVSWFDNLGGRNQTVAVTSDEVLDTLSGIYFLRNRQLEVGKTETLHIFDSEFYADVPVEILRRETIRLPNFTKVDTLVVQPLQKSAGLFKHTGDILIWMTDDIYKVPVKIVTSVTAGTVTVELVSAESKTPATTQ